MNHTLRFFFNRKFELGESIDEERNQESRCEEKGRSEEKEVACGVPSGTQTQQHPGPRVPTKQRGLFYCLARQLAPRPESTLGIVIRMIRASRPSDQLSMYCRSSRIHASKSTLSRPRSAHKQVRPGRIRSRRRCQR